MSNSESQNRKGKGGRKPKFDYTSEEFLSLMFSEFRYEQCEKCGKLKK